MNTEDVWEKAYRANTQMSVWPWSELISLVMRTIPADQRKGLKVLELGCGPGANIPFFLSLQADFHAIEIAESAVAGVLGRFPELKGKVVRGDFQEPFPFPPGFDLIFDRCAIPCNSTKSIEKTLTSCLGHLKPGGYFIGVDWFSVEHHAYRNPGESIDEYSRVFSNGDFAGLGVVHFFDRRHLESLLHGFDLVSLQHKTLDTVLPGPAHRSATWYIVARKR